MKKLCILIVVLGSMNICSAQEENIVSTLDNLRSDWDGRVESLQSFEGLKNLCRNRDYRVGLVELLDQIHSSNSELLKTVSTKYPENSSDEVSATLKGIETLETVYSTNSFLDFIHTECNEYNFVKNNFSAAGIGYEAEKSRVEIEIAKYVDAITWQINVIGEQVKQLSL